MPAATTTGVRPRRPLPVLGKELGAFAVVGGACLLLDLVVFQLLYVHVGSGAVTSRLVSTLVSMTAAFLGHRFWSFSHRARTGLRREYVLFAAVNALTLSIGLLTTAVVRYPLGQEDPLVLQAANLGSIALGTVLRFLIYRRWVFPPGGDHPPDHPASREP